MDDFRGKVVVITGSASGIGAALARAFAREGARLALLDQRDPIETATAARELGAADTLTAVCDVTSRAALEECAERIVERFGVINVLCNNAGVVVFGSSIEIPEADWDWVLSVNVKGIANGIAVFVPRILETAGSDAHIVNTASGAGLLASAALPLPAYTASKFAVVGLSEALQHEMEPQGIGVTILCPGSVRTNILETAHYSPSTAHLKPETSGKPTPGREGIRRMEPDDVAALVLRAIRERQPYVITHPESIDALEERFSRLRAAYATAQAALGIA